ncbi:nucleotidyltransferase family protein [Clostridium sp.]|uniref:nucleotidyltransferase family protein n=1 Tax=Clostridium sp. TaxID=1506 RepID=UPI00346493F7
MINSKTIIEKLKEKLEPLEYIYAMWLEGSYATGSEDEYSDVDIYIDIKDEYENEAISIVENTLSEISELDYKYVMNHSHPKLRQRIYHLKGSSEYLMIDFCWQLHSRNKEEFIYIRNSVIEAAKVIFDKSGVIQYKDYNKTDYKLQNNRILEQCKYRYSQHDRVIKYVYRGKYLEGYAYYNKYVLEPLISMLRLIYTPSYTDYYLIHISQHIPQSEVEKLEFFAKISSIEDIAEKTKLAEIWFSELIQCLNNMEDNIKL